MVHLKAMADDKGRANIPSSLLPWVLGGDFHSAFIGHSCDFRHCSRYLRHTRFSCVILTSDHIGQMLLLLSPHPPLQTRKSKRSKMKNLATVLRRWPLVALRFELNLLGLRK